MFYANLPVEHEDLDELIIRALVEAAYRQDADQGESALLMARARYCVTPEGVTMLNGYEAKKLFQKIGKTAFAKRRGMSTSEIRDDYIDAPDNAFYFDGAYTNYVWPENLVRIAASEAGDHEGYLTNQRYEYRMKQLAILEKEKEKNEQTTS